ncbi:MAG: hypothetical protein LUC43_06425 [Burkholderiales bacterium]|nr:hypothetical protein [Burkholderiales bacterium]
MAKTKENPTSSTGENITPEALEVEEVISVEDEAEGNIYKKSPEEANADDDYLKDIQSTEAKEESDAETAASDQLGPEITGAKTDLKKRPSAQAQQPTNVLDSQEKAEE